MKDSTAPRARVAVTGITLFTLCCASFALAPPAHADPVGPTNPTTLTTQAGSTIPAAGGTRLTAVDDEVIRLLNVERANLGLQPVQKWGGLAWNAAAWSDRMAVWGPGDQFTPDAGADDNYRHDTGGAVYDESVGCNILLPAPWGDNSSGGGGETVAMTADRHLGPDETLDPTELAQIRVTGYMNSPSHRNILLSPTWRYAGSGTVVVDNPFEDDSDLSLQNGQYFYNTIRLYKNCRSSMPSEGSVDVSYTDGSPFPVQGAQGVAVAPGKELTLGLQLRVWGWDHPNVLTRDVAVSFVPDDGSGVVDVGSVSLTRQPRWVGDPVAAGNPNSGVYTGALTHTPAKVGHYEVAAAGGAVNDFLSVPAADTASSRILFAAAPDPDPDPDPDPTLEPIEGTGEVINAPQRVVPGGHANINLSLRLPGAVGDNRTVSVLFTPQGQAQTSWTSVTLLGQSPGVYAGTFALSPPETGVWLFVYGQATVGGRVENRVQWTMPLTVAPDPAPDPPPNPTVVSTRVTGWVPRRVVTRAPATVRVVRVSPGAGRTVVVQACRAARCRIVNLRVARTNRAGVARVVVPLQRGWWHYRLVVKATASARPTATSWAVIGRR